MSEVESLVQDIVSKIREGQEATQANADIQTQTNDVMQDLVRGIAGGKQKPLPPTVTEINSFLAEYPFLEQVTLQFVKSITARIKTTVDEIIAGEALKYPIPDESGPEQ